MNGIVIKKPNGSSPSLNRHLNLGDKVTIYIAEHEKGRSEDEGWYLLKADGETSCHNSEESVEKGNIIRTFKDPELGAYYRGGYMWANKRYIQISLSTNREAKMLLDDSYMV